MGRVRRRLHADTAAWLHEGARRAGRGRIAKEFRGYNRAGDGAALRPRHDMVASSLRFGSGRFALHERIRASQPRLGTPIGNRGRSG